VDYILGVSDLTGELMRFAITSIGRQGMMSKANLDKATEVCNFVRACRSGNLSCYPWLCLILIYEPRVQIGRP
jgi:predicted translin family RNA/ssDNA-binding protein